MSVANARTAIAQMFDEAAQRSTGSGRNLANDLYVIVRAAMAGVDLADEQAIAAMVLTGLTPEAIAAAIPDDLADQVVDRLSARLAATDG